MGTPHTKNVTLKRKGHLVFFESLLFQRHTTPNSKWNDMQRGPGEAEAAGLESSPVLELSSCASVQTFLPGCLLFSRYEPGRWKLSLGLLVIWKAPVLYKSELAMPLS